MGNNESVEPLVSNLYVHRGLSGEYIIVNRYLIKDLTERGLWDKYVCNQILAEKGSIANILTIPEELKEIYKTVWELKMRTLIDMAADRGAFIDQSQSLNLFVASPTTQKLTSMHFYSWKKGLKTGCYYLRTRPAVDAIAFTVDQQMLAEKPETEFDSDFEFKFTFDFKFESEFEFKFEFKSSTESTNGTVMQVTVTPATGPTNVKVTQVAVIPNMSKIIPVLEEQGIVHDVAEVPYSQSNFEVCEMCSG